MYKFMICYLLFFFSALTLVGNTALETNDYTALTSSEDTVSFTSGSTTDPSPIAVSIVGDDIFEKEERFFVTIAFSGSPASSEKLCKYKKATVTITDDDLPGECEWNKLLCFAFYVPLVLKHTRLVLVPFL